jgi:glycosyltransferase involved in cell wall biosynthesis
MPLVSIVTPAYNQAQFVGDTIESIRSQDYANIEHIIVDDGSTDHTLAEIRKFDGTYNLHWSTGPNRGQSAALNTALGSAKGSIIGWLNSDDVYLSRDAVSTAVRVFLSEPSTDVIYGDVIEIDEHNNIRRLRTNIGRAYPSLLRSFNFISQPATFLRSRVLSSDALDVSLQCCMDYDLWLRLLGVAEFRHVKGFLAGGRYHAAAKNLSRRDEMRREANTVRMRYAPPGKHASSHRRLASTLFHLKRLAAIRRIWALDPERWTVALRLDSKTRLALRQVPLLYRLVRSWR